MQYSYSDRVTQVIEREFQFLRISRRLRWLPTVAGQIYKDQCGASPTGKCFEMNNT